MKREPAFKTEAELCAAFVAAVNKEGGWTVYPETAGFDILLVRSVDGFQIGVEAKLKLNAKVVNQVLESRYDCVSEGPDCRAVLIPDGVNKELEPVCDYIGVTVLTQGNLHDRWNDPFRPSLPVAESRWTDEAWFDLMPLKRCVLPDYVPDVAAGVPSPVQLSPWKIKAIKIALLLRHRGFVTSKDFADHNIDIRRWRSPGSEWLLRTPQGFVAGPGLPDFQAQHPQAWETIWADIEKGMKPGLFDTVPT